MDLRSTGRVLWGDGAVVLSEGGGGEQRHHGRQCAGHVGHFPVEGTVLVWLGRGPLQDWRVHGRPQGRAGRRARRTL